MDFPLGNPCGKPYDLAMHRRIVGNAISLFESATAPRTFDADSHEWETQDWRQRYMEIKPEDRERLRLAGEKRRIERQHRRDTGSVRSD